MHRHEEIHHPDKRPFLDEPHWPRTDYSPSIANYEERKKSPKDNLAKMEEQWAEARHKYEQTNSKILLVRKYAQEHNRVHRRDRQRQANAAEQPKATQVVEAPALAILDVKGDPEAHGAREQRNRDGQAHNLLAARLRPALFAARGEQCYANLRRLGLLSASGLSSFFTLGTYTANLLVDAPYRLPMRRMTPGFDGSGIYVLGHLVLNLALPATLSAVVRA